jgi:ribosome-binding protein aMBF1 (putative translation factor)
MNSDIFAMSYILNKNPFPAPPDPTVIAKEPNIIIRARHAAGVSQAELAWQLGISNQRVHQIVHVKRS